MAQQLALLGGASIPAQGTVPAAAPAAGGAPSPAAASTVSPTAAAAAPPASPAVASAPEGTADGGMVRYDVNKAFGAIARIHTKTALTLTDRQRVRLDAFMRRYVARTKASKEYTAQHRPHLADPRVVNGFRPLLKEIIYQIVIERSAGAHVWDLDGNRYVDALNGFGMNLFGWQPDFVSEAVRRQLELGYEIGPQHPLAGVVAEKVCALTGFDRAGLCNTGSEAVMGAVRIARTVTGRSRIALFTGAYHGIFDEVIVRATRNQKAYPAAPGIMPNTAENVLVLDYGTPESLQILREHADELAAVLVEPVQSRRPDFRPVEFLKEVRELTRQSGALLIFDEVVTGFRAHPRGAQAVLGIDADLASYGKVVGGGFPIGVIAGRREYMDALDGGGWQYGDDSIPTVGVTYFAGTFVRHPLALAAANAVLDHLAAQGPDLQAGLTARTEQMVADLNAFLDEVGAPIAVKSFASVWKTFFNEDHPLQDLLFAMMRSRGIHILDNFPCFMTTAHSAEDIAAIVTAFKESVLELQEADFLPRRKPVAHVVDASKPPVPGARLGRDADGKPAWFVPNPDAPGKYLKVS
jgi:glutamate-1-semialdehyde aminotransferase